MTTKDILDEIASAYGGPRNLAEFVTWTVGEKPGPSALAVKPQSGDTLAEYVFSESLEAFGTNPFEAVSNNDIDTLVERLTTARDQLTDVINALCEIDPNQVDSLTD